MISGLRYNGVPTLVPYNAVDDDTILDTPISPILLVVYFNGFIGCKKYVEAFDISMDDIMRMEVFDSPAYSIRKYPNVFFAEEFFSFLLLFDKLIIIIHQISLRLQHIP
jgi:hypothetical protein